MLTVMTTGSKGLTQDIYTGSTKLQRTRGERVREISLGLFAFLAQKKWKID